MTAVRQRSARYALALAALTGLFASRVVAQAIQRWHPVDALPPFDMFQGGSTPYGFLLAVQIILLAWMGISTRQVSAARRPNARTWRVLLWVGMIYMAGSVARIAVGLGLTDAPPWFTAWIPAAFHIVLAGFVLTLARYHRGPRDVAGAGVVQ